MTNCILFALALYWRRWRWARSRNEPCDDYIIIRASRVPWGLFHVLHGRLDPTTDQIKVVSYKPNTPTKRDLELVFQGHVARGDKPQDQLPER